MIISRIIIHSFKDLEKVEKKSPPKLFKIREQNYSTILTQQII